METDGKYREIVEKLTELKDTFMLVCHDETENNTTVYTWITYSSGLGIIGTIIDAFMENCVPSHGRDKVIRDIRGVVNFAIERNKTQISEESQKMLDGLEESLTQNKQK